MTTVGITMKADVPEGDEGRSSRRLWSACIPAPTGTNASAGRCSGSRSPDTRTSSNLYLPSGFEGHPLRKDFPAVGTHGEAVARHRGRGTDARRRRHRHRETPTCRRKRSRGSCQRERRPWRRRCAVNTRATTDVEEARNEPRLGPSAARRTSRPRPPTRASTSNSKPRA